MSDQARVARRRACWGFAAALVIFAIGVKTRSFSTIDLQISHGIEMVRRPWLTRAARALTFFGSSAWTFIAISGMCLWWRYSRRTRMLLWGSWAVGMLLEVLLRMWVGQWRPDVAPLSVTPDWLGHLRAAGFPSGHAFRSALVCEWWANDMQHRQPARALVASIAAGVLMLLVGLSRLYIVRHWSTDVVGGWLVAALILNGVKFLQG